MPIAARLPDPKSKQIKTYYVYIWLVNMQNS